MSSTGQDAATSQTYKVVVNQEEQYSIWPADRTTPPGWRDSGSVGTKADCLAHIRAVWTDMRPLSVRRADECAGGPDRKAGNKRGDV